MPRKISSNKKLSSKVKNKSSQSAVGPLLLFGMGLLLFFLVIVPGENIWLWIHNFIFSLLGVCAILLPILLICIAVLEAFGKSANNLKLKISVALVIIVFACSLFFVFVPKPENVQNINWFSYIVSQYKQGFLSKNSGLFGALMGAPMIWAFGTLGARITNIIILFVLTMFVTGTTLIELFRAFSQPAKIIKHKIEDKNAGAAEVKNRKTLDIDVNIGE